MKLKKNFSQIKLLRKKMLFAILYGIIFLITTISYYFVNISQAQNILKIATSVKDVENEIEECKFELKVPENNENYSITMPNFLNGFVVKEYILVNEDEYNQIEKHNIEETQDIIEINQENNITEEVIENKEEIEQITIEDEEIITDDIEQIDIEKILENSTKLLPNEEIELNEKQIEEKNIFALARYDIEEKNEQKLYNKIISETTEKNTIIVSGYMPKDATLKVTEVNCQDVESKLSKQSGKSVKLEVAYDIKIMVDEVEYEPEDFDENVKVEITGNENKKINIWHLKDDNETEKMQIEQQEESVYFETASFSIYGVELLDEETESETPINLQQGNMLKSVRGAASINEADSILEINDYDSDYYYYMGKNYTNNISGTNTNTYTNNLAQVTINYYGYAAGETNGLMKGRISLTEREDIVRHIKCVPVENGNISIELMDNPFMDKPTGYGFGGWISGTGTITTNSNTKAQILTVEASGSVTINVYANWTTAKVVYLNQEIGNDNLNDGLTESSPFGSWEAACKYLYNNSNNRTDRENNIIVLTGNIDSSINYSKDVTGTVAHYADITYSVSSSFTSGGTYLITDEDGENALTISGGNIANEVLQNNVEPSANSKWIITSSGSGYTIRNAATNQYLTYNSGLKLSNSSFTWTFSNRRFSYKTTGLIPITYYISFSLSSWSTRIITTNATLCFVTYTKQNERQEYSTTLGNSKSNSYYSSSRNLALTVTSLYNHTDYRDSATVSLNTNGDWSVYNDFQIDYVDINASGYTSDTSGTSAGSPYFYGNNYNTRIGRGMYPINNTSATAATFRTVYGGATSGTVGSTSNDNNAYKLVVETGKYSQIEGFHGSGSNSYYGTVYMILGNDYDRVKGINDKLKNYNRCTVNRGSGINGKNNIEDPAFIINVKSGSFGNDFITDHSTSEDITYAGIYVGGHGTSAGTSTRDISDRYCIVEGGNIANIIGGLKITQNSGVKTRIYVKGGIIKNIVGGAGVSTTYEDRIIQVTGGKILYSISGGSNGVKSTGSGSDGKLENGNTLVYIGGNAQIGDSTTIGTSLYEVEAGCVLGAGNGNSRVANSGQVNNAHIIVNDNAHILNSVYGGGNYGIVGDPNATSATAKIEILGGTIDNNVYGGANQNNIYGLTAIDIKGGQVKGTVYGGSNSSGTISTTSSINVIGGTLGESSNTISDEVLFGGGYGQSTKVTGNATINILDTNGDVNIYGSAYGGSSLGEMQANTIINIQDDLLNSNTINIRGNIFAGGKGNNQTAAIVQGNSTINVDGANLPEASVFGGNDINGTTNGNIIVNIGATYDSTVLNVYGGGNLDSTGTEADTVKVYLFGHANVTNAFNGGKSADLITAGTSDLTRAIYLQGGNVTNLFGGSDTTGTVTASHVYIQSGTATNVYGGNNEGGQTAESFVYVTGGTLTNVYGGGYQATTPITNVSLTGGTVTNGFGGGNAANVTTANIILDGTDSTDIYGGSNQQGTVNTANVTITSGTVTNVYGGNNAGGNTVNTNVVVTSGATNVYGGGNQAITSGNTNVKLKNCNITNNAYGGGNGIAAVVVGNSQITVEGLTTILGDLFGGGNAAANGTISNNNSMTIVLITGGTISGDIYGAANTSVVYGNTEVKIGSSAVNNNNLEKKTINIGGTVFGGGKSNLVGSENYDFSFESVTGDVNIVINAYGYDNGVDDFDILGSIFGSGNAAKISGDGYINISNYGANNNIKENISIQRATQVVLDNSTIHFAGTTDRTNEIATAIYTFNRIDDIILKNNTTIYLDSGVNITSKLESLDSSNNKESVIIGENGISNQNVDNRIYLSQGKNIILKTEEGNNGEVVGMAFMGLFKNNINNTGIYASEYTQGDTIPIEIIDLFERNSYIQGKHYVDHNITEDGFYTNYDEEGNINIKYIEPTPENANYYQWIVGRISNDIFYEDIELIATKYATTAAYVLNLDGLSYPNTTIKIVNFDVSNLTNTITLNNPNNVPNIASTAYEADTKFGLTMTAGNNGWQTRGTTNFLNNNDITGGYSGTTEYVSDNSSTTPSFSFYMAHSKNISETKNLGTVTIKLEATYMEDEEIKIRNAYIILRLSTNNTLQMGRDYYEGSITPGRQYDMFPTTTTTITKESSFSAYYSLFIGNYSATSYYEGFSGHYYHTLTSTCVLPEGTKLTLIDKSGNNVKYYYYIVTQQDENNSKRTFRFTDFKNMDSTQEMYDKDGSYYNSSQDLVFEEFIVHVDFKDTTLDESLVSENFLVELRDAYDNSVTLTVNTAQYPMLFSVYDNLNVTSSINLTTDKNVIYIGQPLDINISTQYTYNKNENQDIVYDTTHIDDQFGVRITILSGSSIMTASNLEGIYIKYRDTNYYARSDGSFRIKIADSVSNVLADMRLFTGNGHLETGTYTIAAQSFGSVNGTYFSSEIASTSTDIQLLQNDYGLIVSLDDDSVIIDKTTGKNINNTNNLNFVINYSGNFEHPKLAVSLYRRLYNNIYSYEYEKVNLADYISDTLTSTSTPNEYLVTNNLGSTQNLVLQMLNNLTTGTYKVVFSLYDGNNFIANMNKYIIIK